MKELKRAPPLFRSRMLALRIDDRERARHRKTQPARNRRQTRLDFVAIRQIDPRLRNGLLQYGLQPDVHVQRLKRVHALLQSLGNRQIPRLDPDSVIGLRRALRHQQQVAYFFLYKLVVTPDILFVNFQARGHPKKMLYLVDALHALVRLNVVNRLQRTYIVILHFVNLFFAHAAAAFRPALRLCSGGLQAAGSRLRSGGL